MTKAKDGQTQFGRVMKHLGIEPIYAHSPQAKGRVERVNETLQDRLIKELRFLNINTIEQANQHLKDYMRRFNPQFSKLPQEPLDLHRPLDEEQKRHLDYHCSIQIIKTISKDLLIKHERKAFKMVPPNGRPRQLIKQKVVMCQNLHQVSFFLNGKPLEYELIKQASKTGPTLNRKNMDQYLDAVAKVQEYWALTSE